MIYKLLMLYLYTISIYVGKKSVSSPTSFLTFPSFYFFNL